MRWKAGVILYFCVAFGLILSSAWANTSDVCESVKLNVGGVSIVNQKHRQTDAGFFEFLVKGSIFEEKIELVDLQSVQKLFQPLIKQLKHHSRVKNWHYDVYIAHSKAKPVKKLQEARVVSSYPFAANPVALLQAGVSAEDLLTAVFQPSKLYYYAGSPIIEGLFKQILPNLGTAPNQIVALRKPCKIKGRTPVDDLRSCQYMMWKNLFETAWENRPAYAILGLHPYLQYRAVANARGETARTFLPILPHDPRMRSPLEALVARSGSKREACAQALGRYLVSDETQAKIAQYRFADFSGQVWWPIDSP